MAPMREADVCTTGSGPTTCSKSPRCSTTLGAIGISWPPRVSDRRYRPRVQSCSDASARVRPAIFGFVSITSATETGTSRSSLSSISSPRDPTRSTMTCRGPEIAITSPAWSTRPGSASAIPVPSADPVDEQPVLGCASLRGCNGRSHQRGSFGQSVGAQLEDIRHCFISFGGTNTVISAAFKLFRSPPTRARPSASAVRSASEYHQPQMG